MTVNEFRDVICGIAKICNNQKNCSNCPFVMPDGMCLFNCAPYKFSPLNITEKKLKEAESEVEE